MKETRIKIKMETTKEIVFHGDYCSNECNFITLTECLLFKKFIKREDSGKQIRCNDCKKKYFSPPSDCQPGGKHCSFDFNVEDEDKFWCYIDEKYYCARFYCKRYSECKHAKKCDMIKIEYYNARLCFGITRAGIIKTCVACTGKTIEELKKNSQ